MIIVTTLLYINVGLISKPLKKKVKEHYVIPDIEIYFYLRKNIDKISLHSKFTIDFQMGIFE